MEYEITADEVSLQDHCCSEMYLIIRFLAQTVGGNDNINPLSLHKVHGNLQIY